MTVDQLTALAAGTVLWSDEDLTELTYCQPNLRQSGSHQLRQTGWGFVHLTQLQLTHFHLTREAALRSLIARKEAELRELQSQLPV